MFTFVSADWVQERLDSPEILLLDPRSALRYMAGHPKNAISLPAAKATGANGLRPVEELAQWIGAAGLDDRRVPVLYDGADGRNAAMLAWILLYLGRTDVHLMDVFWEKWAAEKREAFYRPVAPVARQFTPRVRPELRATLEDVRVAASGKFVDFRSADEFTGKLDTEGKPGHIPGAVNLVWQELSGADHRVLAPREKLQALFAARGIGPGDRVVAYCRSGLRASLGFLALAQLGVPVALYDGSYAEWARSGLPVESSEINS
jgi:thiosulfate/3-mercaptopyruvate sulfurtransferase